MDPEHCWVVEDHLLPKVYAIRFHLGLDHPGCLPSPRQGATVRWLSGASLPAGSTEGSGKLVPSKRGFNLGDRNKHLIGSYPGLNNWVT